MLYCSLQHTLDDVVKDLWVNPIVIQTTLYKIPRLLMLVVDLTHHPYLNLVAHQASM